LNHQSEEQNPTGFEGDSWYLQYKHPDYGLPIIPDAMEKIGAMEVLQPHISLRQGMRPALTRVFPVYCLIIGLFISLLCASQAAAHTLGQSYIYVNVSETGLFGRLELPIDTLQTAIQEDKPEFSLTHALVEDEKWQIIESYIRQHLQISQDGQTYRLEFGERDMFHIEIAEFLVVQFVATAPGPIPEYIDFSFSAIFHAISEHRLGLVVESNYKTGLKGNHKTLSNFFAPGRETFAFNTAGEPWIKVLFRFVVEGVIHIWIGLDHVLFILTLLLMSVVAQAGQNYRAEESIRPAVINILTLITIFTVAHTITLFLGLKGWVRLPSTVVEPVIALSIVVVALNNIFPMARSRLAVGLVIFGFGLFHGLGFASVLVQLAVGAHGKLLSLLGFNIGVELGQLVIVICVFPVLFLIRNKTWYNAAVLRGISAVIALIGAWWFFSRIFLLAS